MLDLRWPIGLLFLLVGLMLAGWGLARPHGALPVTLTVDLNLGWGLVMASFGAVMTGWAHLVPTDGDEPR
jgi:hypothetical protein